MLNLVLHEHAADPRLAGVAPHVRHDAIVGLGGGALAADAEAHAAHVAFVRDVRWHDFHGDREPELARRHHRGFPR